MLHEKVIALAKAPNFAAFTTLFPNGYPATHIMWIDCDDDHLLINTEVHRAKYKNVQRDPRVAVSIWEEEDPYSYMEVRGRVVATETGPHARRHIDELNHKYHGHPYRNRIRSERVLLRIAPERQRA